MTGFTYPLKPIPRIGSHRRGIVVTGRTFDVHTSFRYQGVPLEDEPQFYSSCQDDLKALCDLA